jgi:tRNA A-37 threonylcarbamoyl transferase component Bud32
MSDKSVTCPHCGHGCLPEHQYCPACGFPVGTVGSVDGDKFIGKTLPGGYHVLDLISVGGMGRVYRAEQSVLGRTVAVKVIHPHLLSDENSALRFLTEARAASQLNHPNSVAVFDFGRTDDGQPYIVMEFLRGKDLARVAYEEGPLPFQRIVNVLKQALAALADAHDLGIVHRDLKPENIILEPLRRGGDFVKVVDFGLAKLRADTRAPSVTSPGIVCGTPDYMAPEQGRGDAIDGRSDLYSVGVVLFQLLTGRLPFEAESPTQVVMMHLSIPVPDPRQIAPERDIPDPLVDVVFKALAKDADRRYQDSTEFADALTYALEQSESLPPARTSFPGPSIAPGATVVCPACNETVTVTKFCGECGARLPVPSGAPDFTAGAGLTLPFVGRDEDLGWLNDRFQLLRDSVVGARIVGEPGCGKSRLLREFMDQKSADGHRIITVTPDPFGSEVACYALRSAVSELSGILASDVDTADFPGANPDAKRGLVELFRGSPRADDRRSPIERRFSMAEALRWALKRGAELAGSRFVILSVDELHRIDGPSRHAFADVMGEPPNCPALILGAHTPGFESGWGADRAAARVLGGLPPPTAARLLRTARSSDRLKSFDNGTHHRGVLPLYVEQLLRFSLEGGAGDAPSRLGDLIALRVDTLDPDARRALQALTVLGDESMLEDLTSLLGGALDLRAGLEQLADRGMVEKNEDTYSTTHPLLREVVLTGIPAGVRRELHKKALGICQRRGAPIEACANHAYEAADSFQALLLLEQVADRASMRGDSSTEVFALRRGLELARQEIYRGELDDPLRAVLIFSRKLGASLTRAGDFADAEGVLREALDVAGPNGADRARVLSALAHVAHGRQRDSEAFGYIDQAIEAARQSGSHDMVSSLTDTRRAWAS